jgi:hypothetical protein
VTFRNEFCCSGLSDKTKIALLERRPFLPAFDPVFNIFLSVLRLGMLSFIPKLRVHHSLVTSGTLNVELSGAINLKL